MYFYLFLTFSYRLTQHGGTGRGRRRNTAHPPTLLPHHQGNDGGQAGHHEFFHRHLVFRRPHLRTDVVWALVRGLLNVRHPPPGARRPAPAQSLARQVNVRQVNVRLLPRGGNSACPRKEVIVLHLPPGANPGSQVIRQGRSSSRRKYLVPPRRHQTWR